MGKMQDLEKLLRPSLPYGARCFIPIDEMPEVVKNVKGGLRFVVVNGKQYNVDYRDNGTFFLSPVDGYVPCGWFTIKQLEKDYAASIIVEL